MSSVGCPVFRSRTGTTRSVFFVLSKTLDLLLDPWWWVFLPVLVGSAARCGRPRRLGAGLVATGLLVFALLSLPFVTNRLWHELEADVVSTMRPDVTYDVVVLLGGTVASFGATPDTVSWGDNVERLTVTFDLLRTGKARHVIVSGGQLREGLPTEADYLARQLEAWGIEKSRILIEPEARNTVENAERSKALLEARGFKTVLMVTSAFHLPRAQGCFRAVGLEPDVLPVDFRMRAPEADTHWLPRAGYFGDSAQALRELFGRVTYRLTGKAK
jgi:uncharacterized SAM-binding protein YcdF (DUF218 family)